MNARLPRPVALAAGGFIAVYAIYFSIGSLLAEFTHDDLMNCYRGWFYSLSNLLVDHVAIFRPSPMYRPFGALIYKLFFGAFDFDLLPLRIFLLLVLGFNTFLVYALCRALTNSQQAGLFGALVHAYHGELPQLYYNTGMLYDICAFVFYFLAVLVYVRVRHSGRLLDWRHGLTIVILYILALNSKELAASLPLTLAAYELLWHFPSLGGRTWVRWFSRETWGVWATAAITVAFAMGRVLSPEGGLGNVGHYKVTISVAEYFSKLAHYLSKLFYVPTGLDSYWAALFLAAFLAVAVVSRSRVLCFGSILFFTGILPMAFIAPRALSSIYIPLAGLSLFAGAILGFASQRIERLFRKPAWQHLAFVTMLVLTGLGLWTLHPRSDHLYVPISAEYSRIRDARVQLQRLHPHFPEKSRILILETPFPEYSPGYNNLFMIRLAYRDDSLEIQERARLAENRQELVPSDYDYILSYRNDHWANVDPATVPREIPEIAKPAAPE